MTLFRKCILTLLTFAFISNVFGMEGDSLRVKKERIFEVFSTYGLNSNYSEISPVFYNTELIFCSDREWNKNTYGMSDWHETKHYNMFRSSMNFATIDSVEFEKVKIFNHFLVTHMNVGPITFDKDFKNAVYVENEFVKESLDMMIKCIYNLIALKLKTVN